MLFGVITLAASPLYRENGWPGTSESGIVSYSLRPWMFISGSSDSIVRWASLFWLVALPLGYVATVFYYRRRARLTGVESPLRPYVLTGLALLATLWVLAGDIERPLRLIRFAHDPNGFPTVVSSKATDLAWLVCAAMAFAGVLAYVVARKVLTGVAGGWAWIAVLLGVFALRIESAVSSFLGLPDLLNRYQYSINTQFFRGLTPLLTVAIGLFVLARVERSATLAVFSTAFLGIALTANLYNVENIFYRFGVYPPAPQINAIVPPTAGSGNVSLSVSIVSNSSQNGVTVSVR
ncbi:MAG: hypothetical protein M1376_09340 [Planctomycetes bacterium]|nr:hypothetical protein [Planctomycetota bacterium]